ncbi:type II toxin-antitoxin system VapC family toxin [Pseudonocardia sp.]|uniref:type II toxin-antitoxin system VapC family toxin n=1 Tax=Pseudonocardia sp. TaxID=60912 RepID=UPI0026267B78|nr:type II toxin-antitoxin system VapC family toxin [Pseudonocardia sp.]
MTTLLLDTHAYVWAVTAPHLLSERAAKAIADPVNTLTVSAASAWEMAIKHRAGRWPEAELLLNQYDGVLERLGARTQPITAADAIRAGGLSWTHSDPFDRMLAAQALAHSATLVTRDRAFAGLGGVLLLW